VKNSDIKNSNKASNNSYDSTNNHRDKSIGSGKSQNLERDIPKLKDAIIQEFLDLGISEAVLRANVQIVDDIEIDPIIKEVIATPLADALNFRYTRFGWKAKPNLLAALFKNENGETWQAKVYGEDSPQWLNTYQNQGKRTGQYMAPKGIGDKLYLPSIPRETINAIAAKYDLLPPNDDEMFWEWFKNHPVIPLIITEGGKKALAAISQDHIALSLFGVNCGVNDLGIKPELLQYVEGRHVTIAFDRDEKDTTKFKVFKATKKLGSKLTYHAKSKVFIASWDGKLGKGLDDLISKYPEEAECAIKNARDFIRWKLDSSCDLESLISLRVNTPNLTSLSVPKDERFICLKSGKMTYKTELLAKLISEAITKGIPVLVFSHREQLVRALGKRFGLEYRTELTEDGKILGYCLCVDSAHPKAKPPLHGDGWEGCWVVFDECEQVFWHSLNSSTCQTNRPAILKTITEICNNADKIFLADADLTRVSIDYVNSLRDEPLTPWLVVNDYKRPKRKCYIFETKEELFTKVKECINKGEDLLIHTGGQVEKSTYGTINLELLILEAFPELLGKILRIDSETVSDPTHPAFGCMENLDQLLPKYKVAIASPTIETGVSIECNHFDGVFCFASGSQTVDAVGQTIERDRSDAPRYLWATDNGMWNGIGNKSSDPYSLLRNDKENKKLLGKLLGVDDFYFHEEDKKTLHRHTWSVMAARHNIGFKDYRSSVYAKLSEDFMLVDGTIESLQDIVQENKESAKLSAKINHQKKCKKVANAVILDDLEYEKIKKKRTKTESERLSEKKTSLSKRYLTDEITPSLVDYDSDFAWYSKIRLHYFLMFPQYVKGRDMEAIKRLTKDTGFAFSPDINKSCLSGKIQVLEKFDLIQFFDTEKEWSNDILKEWHENVIKWSNIANTHLGVWINPDKTDKNNTPIQCLQRILNKLGLELTKSDRRRVNKGEEPTRFYKIKSLNPDGRAAIFDRWERRDQEILESVSRDSINDDTSHQKSHDTAQSQPQQDVQGNVEDCFMRVSVTRDAISNRSFNTQSHDTVESTPKKSTGAESIIKPEPTGHEPKESDLTWHNYSLGQRVLLWREVDGVGTWHEATVDKILSNLIHAQAVNGYFGDYIEPRTLGLIAPMGAVA